jgi:hypothetical protein
MSKYISSVSALKTVTGMVGEIHGFRCKDFFFYSLFEDL